MKKSLYFRHVVKRGKEGPIFITEFLAEIFEWLSLPLKVFTRKSMGERYFSFASVMFILVPMVAAVFYYSKLFLYIKKGSLDLFDWWAFLQTWGLSLLLIWACFQRSRQRQREVDREPSVFDFERYSYCQGTIWSWLYSFRLKGKPIDGRKVEIVVEPLFFFLIGGSLTLLGQPIGIFILAVSLGQSFSAWVGFRIGDHCAMDIIDDLLIRQDMAEIYKDVSEDRMSKSGFKALGRRPVTEELRLKLASYFVSEDASPVL